jgi:hypothetical protein
MGQRRLQAPATAHQPINGAGAGFPYGPIQGALYGATQAPGIGNLRSECVVDGNYGAISGLSQASPADDFDPFVVTDAADVANTSRTTFAALGDPDNSRFAGKGVINGSMRIRVQGIFPAGFDAQSTKDMVLDSGQFRTFKGSGEDRCVVDTFPIISMIVSTSNDRYGVDMLLRPPQGLWSMFGFQITFVGLVPSDDVAGYTVTPSLLLTYGHIANLPGNNCGDLMC